MAISLYDVTAPTFLQVLAALDSCLDKGLAHAREQGYDPEQLGDARLIDDMFPLHLQVMRAVDHSAGALRDVKAGRFTFPSMERLDYPGLQKLVADAAAEVRGWSREAVDALEGGDMVFDTGRSPATTFKAEAYLLSFALPNLYFHAATAYDILRMKGVPVGKRDWLDQLRTSL
jgi:hypothetical protein